ncbi:MAG: glycosyltransferase family 2 protein [Bacteroidetes bacterium HGW-Bacteroidetes-21]|jgi:glycosyltransferase involved in cell wall biosynthesis|nr:MAG: glycosyltransferase family 2 protein [Bacteroidetes bacterium HGW-Bacteroidetes-21]
MIKISAVIISFNEEKNIERCIVSAKRVADEIVVLDSLSTDKTEEICRSLGVKFFQHAFDGHIEQKNRAITYASSPYVLSLDADEVLSDELVVSILKVKSDWTFDGYYFNRLNNYCGSWIRHCGWYPDRKLRLWDSRKGQWTGINPHDRYEMTPESKTMWLKGDLLHYSYHSVSQHLLQVEKFTNIASKADFARGRRTNLLRIMFYPCWKFLRDYIFRLGILDGYAGYLVCRISAQATFYKNIKLYELQKQSRVK